VNDELERICKEAAAAFSVSEKPQKKPQDRNLKNGHLQNARKFTLRDTLQSQCS
jgi:hypothetical protein